MVECLIGFMSCALLFVLVDIFRIRVRRRLARPLDLDGLGRGVWLPDLVGRADLVQVAERTLVILHSRGGITDKTQEAISRWSFRNGLAVIVLPVGSWLETCPLAELKEQVALLELSPGSWKVTQEFIDSIWDTEHYKESDT